MLDKYARGEASSGALARRMKNGAHSHRMRFCWEGGRGNGALAMRKLNKRNRSTRIQGVVDCA